MDEEFSDDIINVSAVNWFILLLFFVFEDKIVFLNKVKIIIDPAKRIRTVKINCSAPIDIPKQTLQSIKDNVNGSFTAVLNLTTDNAPTRPSDKANEDLTTAINALTLNKTMARVCLLYTSDAADES